VLLITGSSNSLLRRLTDVVRLSGIDTDEELGSWAHEKTGSRFYSLHYSGR
jgi:hypothetical protein